MNIKTCFRFIMLLAAVLALGFVPSAFAASGNWNVDAAGNWNTAGNWSPAAVPGTAAGDVVGLNFNLTAARIVTLDTAATMGTLNLGDPTTSFFGYTLSGSSTLTFNNSGSGANLVQATVGGAADTISAPLTLADNLTIFNINGLTLSGAVGDGGGAKGITKNGAGTLTVTGTDSYTGPTTVNRGTLDIGGGTANGSISSSSALSLGGGTVSYTRTGGNAQNFNGVTLTGGSSVIKNTVSTTGHTMALGAISRTDTAATVDLAATGIINTTTANVNGILGGWATVGNNTSSGTVGGWSAVDGSGNIISYNSYTSANPSGVNNANNYKWSGNGSLSANTTVNSLVMDGASGDYTINSGVTLTLTSGGLFIGGSQRWLYAGAASSIIKSGLASGELYLHCNNGGFSDYQIRPVIADGAVATKVIKDGPGILKFWGGTGTGYSKTYTGGTVVNGGTLQLSFNSSADGTGIIRGSLTINPGATVEMRDADALGYTSPSVSVTNVTVNGGTLTATGSGNQGLYTTFNLTGGTMSASTYNFGSAAYCAINSLASPVMSSISGGIYLKGDITSLPITTALGTVPSGIDLQISSAIGGDSGKGITKSGLGTLSLTAASTYSGLTTVSAGALRLGSSGSSGTGTLVNSPITVASGAELTLTYQDVTGYNVNLALTNAGTVKQVYAYSETLNRPIILNGGTITSTAYNASHEAYNFDGNYIRTLTGTANYISGSGYFGLRTATCYFTNEASSTLTISCIVQEYAGSGSTTTPLRKTGAGTLTLTAANTYRGITAITNGTLALSGSGSISSSQGLWVGGGATFDVSAVSFTLPSTQPLSGAGTINGTINVASGGAITATNMSIGGATFAGTATVNFNSPMSTTTAPLVVSGVDSLNVGSAANAITINIPTTALAVGTYHLVAYSGSLQGSAGISAFKLGTRPGGAFSYTIVNNAGYVDLQVAALSDVWSGAGSSEWSANVLVTKNWKQSGSPKDFVNGDDVLFDDTVTGTTTVDISVADVTPASVTFNNASSNYTLQGSAAIAGNIGLTKSFGGTLAINNVNKFTGAVTINAGTLAANSIANGGVSSALGAGTSINLGGATLSYTGGNASSDRSIAMTAGSTLDVPSGGTSLSLTGAVSGAFTLTKTGAGTLVLQNTGNTYGATTINGGTVSVAANTALGNTGPLNFDTGTLDITGSSAFSSYKSVVLNSGGGTIQADNSAGVTLYAAMSGVGALTKTGTGSLTLSAVSGHAGGTVVNQGTLVLATGGGTGCITNALTINSGATVNLTAQDALGYSSGVSTTPINIVGGTLNNGSSGNNGYRSVFNLTGGTASSSGGGTYNFSPSYGAAINSLASTNVSTISAGLTLRSDGLNINVAQGTVPSGIDLSISGTIGQSSSGYGIVKSGAGTLALGAAESYSGQTVVSNGVLQLVGGGNSSGGTLISSAVTVRSGAELQLGMLDVLGFNNGNSLTNEGTIKQISANSETLYRPIILNGGTMTSTAYDAMNHEAYNFFGNYIRTLAGTANYISGSGNLGLRTGSCYFTNEAGSTLTIGCVVQGYQVTNTTPLNKTGAGTLTLSAANTYSGATYIDAGTLALSGSGSIANSTNIVVSSGAVFDVSAASFTLANQTLSGAGSVAGTVTAGTGAVITSTNLSMGGLAFAGTATVNVTPNASVAPLIVSGVNGLDAGSTTGSITVNVGTSPLAAGTYHLIGYAGSLQGSAGASALRVGTNPGGAFLYTVVDNGGVVDLQVTSATAFWTGAGSSEWSTNVLTTKNWLQNGAVADYANGVGAVFDDSVTGTTTVDISVADVTPLSVAFSNVNSNYVLEGSAAIAGSIGLIKTGTGMVAINNVNKFTGAVTINSGTLAASSIANGGVNSALGAGATVALGGGALSYTGPSASSDRAVGISSDSTVEVTAGGTALTLGGVVTGAGALTKAGNGTLVLTNLGNSYASTYVNAGTLSVSTNNHLGGGAVTFGGSGGTLDFTGSSALSFSRTFTFNTGGTIQVDNTAGVTISSALVGTGGLTKSGSNTLTLSGLSTYAGGTVVNAGTLSLNNGGYSAAILGSLTINSGATVALSTVNAFGWGSASTSVTNVSVVGGVLDNTTSGDQGYYTAFNLTGGTMSSASGYWIFGSAANSRINSHASSNTATVGGGIYLKGDLVNLPIATEVGTATNGIDLNITGVINGDSGKGIVKSGAGYLRLANGNTYSGATIVNGGTLSASGYSCLGSSSSFSVSSNAVLRLNGYNLFVASHGAAMGNSRVITVDASTLLMDTGCESRFGNVTLMNGSTWTANRPLTSYDSLLANTDTGAATVLVTNTTGTAASTMNGASGIHLQGIQNFNVADVTGDAAADLTVSMILDNTGAEGGTAGGIDKLGAGTMTLTAANTYSNNTIISAGTLALSGSGSINNSANIIVAGGAAFDVSGLASTCNLVSGQALTNSGGTAAILGNLNTGSGKVGLTYASGTPALTVSGAFTLAGTTTFTINNTGAQLAHGSYKVISKSGGGAVAGTAPAVTVTGNGTAGTAALQISGGELTLVVNGAPVASNFDTGAISGIPQTVAIIGGKHAPTDPDDDPLTVSGVNCSSGATVSTDGTNVTYTSAPTFTGTDSFSYTVSDAYGGTATATVTVTVAPNSVGSNSVSIVDLGGGNFQLTFAGIPSFAYALDWTANLDAPVAWTPQMTNRAGTNGMIVYTNQQSASPSFWKTRYVP
jgi:fibronectin-binding autotransporter adhesin